MQNYEYTKLKNRDAFKKIVSFPPFKGSGSVGSGSGVNLGQPIPMVYFS